MRIGTVPEQSEGSDLLAPKQDCQRNAMVPGVCLFLSKVHWGFSTVAPPLNGCFDFHLSG